MIVCCSILQYILRGEGLTRIALRKYTSFGVHLAIKHFGARRPGMLQRPHWGSGGMEWPGLLVPQYKCFGDERPVRSGA